MVRKEVAAATGTICFFLAGGMAASLLQAFFHHVPTPRSF
jgi:hypothetical protein